MNRNVFILITDCLRKDNFEKMKIYKHLDFYIDNAYSTAPSTHFAVPAILTGSYPFEIINDAKINKYIYNYLPAKANKLGYYDIYITGNVVTSRVMGYYVNRGIFEDFLDFRDTPLLRNSGPFTRSKVGNMIFGIKDKIETQNPKLFEMMKKMYTFMKRLYFPIKRLKMKDQNTLFSNKIRAGRIIEKFDEIEIYKDNSPVFGYLHFMDTHSPYGIENLSAKKLKIAENLAKKLYYMSNSLSDKELDILRELYEGEVEYLDKNLEILINKIDKKFGLDKSLVIILSDHGEAFGEKGVFTHPGDALIEELLHVPLGIIGDVREINISNEGIFSTRKVHELVLKYMFNKQEIKITTNETELAFGYKKNERKKKYDLRKVALISGKGIKILNYTEDERVKKGIDEILISGRKKYLKGKI